MCVQWAGNVLSLGVFDKGHYKNSTIAWVYLLSNVNKQTVVKLILSNAFSVTLCVACRMKLKLS